MKVYRLTLYGPGGSCIFDNPEDLKYDMEEENKQAKMDLDPDEYKPFDIPKCIKEIKKLQIGEKWTHDLGEIECLEMTKREFENLSEFPGW